MKIPCFRCNASGSWCIFLCILNFFYSKSLVWNSDLPLVKKNHISASVCEENIVKSHSKYNYDIKTHSKCSGKFHIWIICVKNVDEWKPIKEQNCSLKNQKESSLIIQNRVHWEECYNGSQIQDTGKPVFHKTFSITYISNFLNHYFFSSLRLMKVTIP